MNFSEKSGKLVLEMAAISGVTYETKFIGTKRSTPEVTGEVFATVKGNSAEYEMTGEEVYLRAVVNSSRPHPNPSYDGQLEQAWTQPVGWRKALEAVEK